MQETKEEFKRGDVVRLKSGGPSLTVSEHKNGTVSVVWFDYQGQVFNATLLPELIEHVPLSPEQVVGRIQAGRPSKVAYYSGEEDTQG